MMSTWTYSAKWLIPVIIFTLSFLLLNPVITTSDQKDIYINYELPRCDSKIHKVISTTLSL